MNLFIARELFTVESGMLFIRADGIGFPDAHLYCLFGISEDPDCNSRKHGGAQ